MAAVHGAPRVVLAPVDDAAELGGSGRPARSVPVAVERDQRTGTAGREALAEPRQRLVGAGAGDHGREGERPARSERGSAGGRSLTNFAPSSSCTRTDATSASRRPRRDAGGGRAQLPSPIWVCSRPMVLAAAQVVGVQPVEGVPADQGVGIPP